MLLYIYFLRITFVLAIKARTFFGGKEGSLLAGYVDFYFRSRLEVVRTVRYLLLTQRFQYFLNALYP